MSKSHKKSNDKDKRKPNNNKRDQGKPNLGRLFKGEYYLLNKAK